MTSAVKGHDDVRIAGAVLPSVVDGIGTVREMQVRCKTAEAQATDRVGYEWRTRDYHDVRLLHERLQIPLPKRYNVPTHESR
jgi:hypothetical protein